MYMKRNATCYTYRFRNEFPFPSKENVVLSRRIFPPASGPYQPRIVRPERQRMAKATPISPSMPIYVDVYLTRYEGGGRAPLLLREIKDTRAPRRGPYM